MSTEALTTETCFCGAVQLAFDLGNGNLLGSFVCNCVDCRKLTASAFASNFTVKDTSVKYVRGLDKVKTFSMTKTIKTGSTMTNHFCGECGSLMYRVSTGWPGCYIMRIGQVDDFEKVEGVLKPGVEQFTKDRIGWLKGAVDAKQYRGNFYGGETEEDVSPKI